MARHFSVAVIVEHREVVAAEDYALLMRERDELMAALATYGTHKRGCASGWRAATGSSQIGPCDCGLGAAIAKAEGK